MNFEIMEIESSDLETESHRKGNSVLENEVTNVANQSDGEEDMEAAAQKLAKIRTQKKKSKQRAMADPVKRNKERKRDVKRKRLNWKNATKVEKTKISKTNADRQKANRAKETEDEKIKRRARANELARKRYAEKKKKPALGQGMFLVDLFSVGGG